VEAENIKIDLLRCDPTENYQFLHEIIKQFVTIKRLGLNFVSSDDLSNLNAFLKTSQIPAEIESFATSMKCTPCNNAEKVLFVKSDDKTESIPAMRCQKCGAELISENRLKL